MTVETDPVTALPSPAQRRLSSGAGTSAARGNRFTCGALYVTFRGAGLLLSKGAKRSSPCFTPSSAPTSKPVPNRSADRSTTSAAHRSSAALTSLRFEDLLEILDV